MRRSLRRASESNGRRLQRKEWNAFVDVTDDTRERRRPGSDWMPDQAWLNNQYSVQAHRHRTILGRRATRLLIRRNDSAPVVAWHDMQRIKNELFGKDAVAIQVFPKADDLVDEFNIYWLWVLEVE